MVEAATEFRKNSFNDSDSAILAKVATTFQNVSDEAISASDSASFIIAQMKAFGIEAGNAEHIIDAVNAVSNNYAVSSGQLAKTLGNMSAALSVGNNSFEESLGLLTAGTEVTRNASKVSRALVSIQSRLNQVIDESSSTGQALTDWYKKHNVAILDQQGQLRSLYDVLTDVAKIWPELTKNEQAYYLNQQAGANQSQNLAAILSNFDTAAKATATAVNSAGSAMKENEAYAESLDFQTNVLKADFQDLANNVIDKQLISALLTLGDAFLKVANTGLGTFITKVGLLAGTGWGLSSLLKVTKIVPVVTSQFSNLATVIGMIGNPAVVSSIGGIGTALSTVGGFAGIALPALLGISTAIVGIITLANALEENAHKAEKQLQDLRTQIDEMEDPSSEYSDLKSRVDELTDSELVRLGVLQSQLDTLKEQEEVLSRQQLAKWQKGQIEDQTTYVTNYDDYGYGVTEAYTYNQAADSLNNFREAYLNLERDKKNGQISNSEYVSSLQSLIDKNQTTITNLRDLKTAYEETGDATYKLNEDQERFLLWADAASEKLATNATNVANAVQAEQDAADGLEDAMSQIEVATYDTSTAAAQLTASLFDQNGQLTTAAQTALSVDGSMASLAQSELQAQQAAAQANYANLILEIQKVGSAAMITAGQLSSMMAMAGVSFGTADSETFLKMRYRQTAGETAEANPEGYNKFVTNYLSKRAKANYEKTMKETQEKLDQLQNYVPTGTGGGSSKKSAEEKAAEEAEKQAKKAQKAQEKAAKESQQAYESAAKSAEQAAQEAARAAEQAAEEAKQKILDSIQELKDASDDFWDSKTDAIEETNKELDRQKQLEEKLKALEEAKQKKILLYKNGQFQYDKDYGTIAKAQADYEETRDKIQRERELEQLQEMKDNATEIFNEMKDIVQNGGDVTQTMINNWLSQMQSDGANYYDSNKKLLNEWLEWARGAITEFTMSVSETVSGSGGSSGSGSSNGGGDGLGLNVWDVWATQHQGDKKDEDERGSPYVDAWYHLFKKELLNGLDLGVNSVFVDYSKEILDGIDDVYEEQDYLQRNQAIKGLYDEMKKLTDQLGYVPDYLKEFMELGAGLKSNIDIIAMQYAQNYDKLGSVGKTMLDAILSGNEDYMVANKSRIADIAGGTTEDLMWWSYVRTAGSAAAAKQLFDKRTEDDKKVAEGIYGDKLSQLKTMIDRAGGIVTDEIYEWATKAIGVLDPFGSGLTSMYSDVVTGNKYLYQSQAALEQLGYHGFLGNFGYTSEGGVSAPTAALIKSKILGSTVSNTREESRNRLIAGNISRIEDNLEDVAHGQRVSQEYINKAKDFIAKTIQENSHKWFDTFDEAEKERLHVQNEQLRVLQSQVEAMESQNTTWDKMLDNEQDIIQDFDTDIQEQVEALRAQMAENSAAWWQTEDKETRDALHEANVELARQIEQLLDNGVQMTYEGHTGVWTPTARNANGTHNFRGGLSLVGENGPELRVLKRGDNIIPANQTANLWKWSNTTPQQMLTTLSARSGGSNTSYAFNVSRIELPNVTDTKSFVQGLKNYALQYSYKR